ncbi:MAG: hypothetical protein PHX51_00875 [Clostridia bacterium]|nr:hypothetical protein [Clostridia bacterium]
MELGKYYYDKLDNLGKSVYDTLADGICGFKNLIITVPCMNPSDVLQALRYEHPEFYYVDWKKQIAVDDLVVKSAFHIPYRLNEIDCVAINAKLKAALYGVNVQASDYRKAYKLHNYLISNLKYSEFDLLKKGEGTVDAALYEGATDAEGFAMAGKYLFDGMKVDNMIVYGSALVNGTARPHVWNIACLDGEFYHIDIALDKFFSRGQPQIAFDYFCLDDSNITRDHAFELESIKCEAYQCNWFYRCSNIVENLSQALDRIAKIKSVDQRYVFKILDCDLTKEAFSLAVQDVISCFYDGQFTISARVNPMQRIFCADVGSQCVRLGN